MDNIKGGKRSYFTKETKDKQSEKGRKYINNKRYK